MNWRILSLLLALSIGLPGCARLALDTRPVTELAQAGPPPALTEVCANPVPLPGGALSAGRVERLWAQDRAALADCGARHSAATRYYSGRDRQLAR